MAAAAITPAQAELIRFVVSRVTNSHHIDLKAARFLKMIFPSSFDARSAVDWL
jgi:hypothetical protein